MIYKCLTLTAAAGKIKGQRRDRMLIEFKIEKNDEGQRLDKFLSKSICNMPSALMYKYIRQKRIKVNRHRAEPGQMLVLGDLVQVFGSDDLVTRSHADEAFMHITPKISVVYEDENIILVEKAPGVIVHSDENESGDTLIDNIKAYLYAKGEYLPSRENAFAPALCNRIDRNTGGIVIAAKTAAALRSMNEAIKQNKLTKKYLCACHGKFEKKEGTIHNYLKKDAMLNRVSVFDKKTTNSRDVKEAITKYRVIETSGELSLVEVELITGRTHQIRAQFSHMGNALLGDGKYGKNRDDRAMGYSYQALYSYSLDFKTGLLPPLEYLQNKHFEVDKKHIDFIKEFEKTNRKINNK